MNLPVLAAEAHRRAAAGAAASPLLLKDTFTDADGTALGSHAMDVGGGWADHSGGQWAVQGGRAANLGGGVASADCGRADGAGAAVVTLADAGSGITGLVCRMADQHNYWLAGIAMNAMAIYEVVAGAFVQRAGVGGSIPVATPHAITVTVAGATITLTLGAEQVSYGAMATHLAATRWGLRKGGGSAAPDTIDDFEVAP